MLASCTLGVDKLDLAVDVPPRYQAARGNAYVAPPALDWWRGFRSAELTGLIKSADRAAAYLEATRLAGFSAPEARRFFGPPPRLTTLIERSYLQPWPAEEAERRYLERFTALEPTL